MKEIKDSQIEKILEELKVDYIDALPATIERLESLMNQEQYTQAREEFHKLKGTGKTYGLDEVTVLGETMERICVEYGEHVEEFLPSAIRLLERIYESRKLNKPFCIEEDGDFTTINNYVTVH